MQIEPAGYLKDSTEDYIPRCTWCMSSPYSFPPTCLMIFAPTKYLSHLKISNFKNTQWMRTIREMSRVNPLLMRL